jgi:hypothetical protein
MAFCKEIETYVQISLLISLAFGGGVEVEKRGSQWGGCILIQTGSIEF